MTKHATKAAFAATLCTALLAACVHSTRVGVRPAEGGQEVSVVKRWHGIVISKCGVIAGTRPCDLQIRNYVNTSIRLDGPGPVYSPDQVELREMNEKGEMAPLAGLKVSGEVRLDENEKTVTISLFAYQGRSWFPLGINGTYGYR